jgi:hypothetical protein
LFPDSPLSNLVTLYLIAFVLIGIYPALRRTVERLRKIVRSGSRSKMLVATSPGDVHAGIFAEPLSSRPLNDFEIIVLRRLAQAGDKALSRKQVNAPLLLGTEILHKTLWSLHRRGMIRIRVSPLLGQRFVLSEAGRQYAIEQGYIIKIHERKKAVG